MLISFIILLTVIQPSYQAIYSCNPQVACGCSTNPVSISRIVGGENAGTATWGWAVSILVGGVYLCGGSIISNSWVITTAHCVVGYAPSQISIYAGSIRRFSSSQNRVISQVIIHPNYNSATYANDIALLRISSPLIMSDSNVSLICIPSVASGVLATREWPAAGTTVVAIGWGSLSEGGSTPFILQQVTLSTVDYRASTCYPLVSDQKVQFCAGVTGGGKDTCQGDSGGPLMMFTPSKQWVLVGLTSYGEGCARPTSAGVYTRVAAYENWIRSTTNGAYWPVTFSHANSMEASRCYLFLFLLLIIFVKFHLLMTV